MTTPRVSDYIYPLLILQAQNISEHIAQLTWWTMQLKRAALCSGVSSVNAPLKMSSVTTNSSHVLISQATRPLSWITPSESQCPSRLSTRFLRRI